MHIIISHQTGLYKLTQEGKEHTLVGQMRKWLKERGLPVDCVWFEDYGQHGEWVLSAEEETVTAFLLVFRN